MGPCFRRSAHQTSLKRSTHMVRPFGHRVTLSAAFPLRRDGAANVQLYPRETPGGWGPLGGFGLGVKGEGAMFDVLPWVASL